MFYASFSALRIENSLHSGKVYGNFEKKIAFFGIKIAD